jgi:hypothetical protein
MYDIPSPFFTATVPRMRLLPWLFFEISILSWKCFLYPTISVYSLKCTLVVLTSISRLLPLGNNLWTFVGPQNSSFFLVIFCFHLIQGLSFVCSPAAGRYFTVLTWSAMFWLIPTVFVHFPCIMTSLRDGYGGIWVRLAAEVRLFSLSAELTACGNYPISAQ